MKKETRVYVRLPIALMEEFTQAIEVMNDENMSVVIRSLIKKYIKETKQHGNITLTTN